MKALILFIIFSSSFLFSGAALLSRPYLTCVTANSVVVNVITDNIDAVSVRFGESLNFSSSVVSSEVSISGVYTSIFIHRVYLEDLSPFTKYYYQVNQDGFLSPVSWFYSAADTTVPFRLVWSDLDTRADTLEIMAGWMKLANPMVAIFTGNIYPQSAFLSDSLSGLQGLLSTVPVLPMANDLSQNTISELVFESCKRNRSTVEGFQYFAYGDLCIVTFKPNLYEGNGGFSADKFSEAVGNMPYRWKIFIPSDENPIAGPSGLKNEKSERSSKLLHYPDFDYVVPYDFHRQYGKGTFMVMDVAPARMKMYVYNMKNQIVDSFDFNK